METQPKMEQSRFADLSLWHSAVDEVIARKQAASSGKNGTAQAIERPNPDHPAVQAANAVAKMAEGAGQIHANEEALDAPVTLAAPGQATTGAAPAPPGVGFAAVAPVSDTNPLMYCASLARNYALAKILGRKEQETYYGTLLNKTEGVCDPHWVEAALTYAQFVASRGNIPYRRWKNLSDFVIEDKLPSKARVALVGDWGTGQPEAKQVLEQIARKKPDVVVHLGDIYYSATQFEVDNYFWAIWRDTLQLPRTETPTFSLSGNHDMFCGGQPYYNLLDKLGQPASYFCLRNKDWQLIALDTGLHDAKPNGKDATFLEDTEVQWLKDKIANRGGRRTALLSHHQLFSAFEDICGQSVNTKLEQQLSPILPEVDIWFWGHEHNQVIYEKYRGVLGRCIGHGAFPIGADEIAKVPKHSEVPIKDLRLRGNPFLNHGYVLMDLDGPKATISYFEDCDENKPTFTETI